ncbi:hypothetical protein E1A91_A07G074900v1 [Gossypium mustelinum]|uniref:Uncharacterized protein n=1 Tax=Gossypium mustelinum TaxID=34275 RepID=A0A5D2YHF5_GOSMU|nr:hypothetical protein E1A91_A07G074900v1 [Gossypium mustelinum]
MAMFPESSHGIGESPSHAPSSAPPYTGVGGAKNPPFAGETKGTCAGIPLAWRGVVEQRTMLRGARLAVPGDCLGCSG